MKTKRAREGMFEKQESDDLRQRVQQVWIDVCMGADEASTPHFQAFLSWYIEKSVTYRPCLGPQEWEEVRTIKQAATVQDVWATLVKAADLKVISLRRKADPLNGRWSLEYSSQKKGSRNATVCEIGQWICSEAGSMSLSLEQSFEKVETTTEDLLLLLHTLWNRAADITCSAEHRVGFHTAALLLGVGGWRSKSVLSMTYKSIEIARVRDPENPERPALVATITIVHVKQRVRIRRDQRNRLKFSITFVPCKPLCILSLLLCKAFADNAFFGGYRTLAELLPDNYRFGSGNIDYEQIPWRDDMLDKPIIPLTYHRLLNLWNRCLFVMGMRTSVRIYSLRVGTAGELDGQLTSALRNYILSHSSSVYEASYHPVQLRENLMRISFGALAGKKDELLTQMRRACLRRDPRAPIYITSKDFEDFEKRRDLTALRGLPQNDLTKGKIKNIRDSLEKLLIDERRQEYFNNIDKGRSVEHLINTSAIDPHDRLHRGISDAARRVSQFFEDEASSLELIQKLTALLRGGVATDDDPEPEQSRTKDSQEETQASKSMPRCLLCPSSSFANPQTLSRHVWKVHNFDHPFHCPECQRIGSGDVTIAASREAWRGDAWVLHVREFHGGDWDIPGAVITGNDGQKGQTLGKRKLPDTDAPYKRVKAWDEPRSPKLESDLDLDWKAECAREHDGEEFWVTGYDGDYDA
ncbi:hypothetical protein ACJ41O_006467 [Fusarium nematophilum]